MSEEEKQAIEKLNSIVKVHKDYMQGVNEETINEKEIKAIEIVLNYIDKLQKENKKYIDVFNSTEKIMNGQERTKDKLLKENVELQKENKELKEELEKYEQLVGFTTIGIKPEDIKVVTDKYISKDIIENKIKELEEVKQKEEKENKDEFGINSNTWAIADWGIEVLKELLGE